MKAWLTAQAVADAALPGWPTTKRGVLDRLEGMLAKLGGPGREAMTRQAKRGATEYHVELLDPEARAALAVALIGRVTVSDDLAARAAAEPEAQSLAVPASEGRDARLAILGTIDRFRALRSLSVSAAEDLFISLYNRGKVEVDGWIRQAVPMLSPRTLARWRAEVRAGRTHKLGVDHGAKRRGKGALEGEEIRLFCLGAIARQPHLSSDHVRTLVADKFPKLALPSSRTFRHQLKLWRERYKVELAKLTNPDAFRSKYRVAGTNSHQVSRLNELWMIDASPADVLTRDGRHSIYACVDIYSRRLQVYVTKTPRAEAVGLLMRRAILAWGICERVKTDNGSDFRAKRTQRLMAGLGIDVETSNAFSPWEKGHVERVIKTLQHDCMTILPGFIGHNVADRKVIEERRAFAQRLGESDANAFCIDLTPVELQAHCDSWAAGRYAARPHDGLNGVTPQQAAAGYVGEIRTVDVHALDVLLAPIAGGDGIRTVSKRGVRVDGRHYLAPSVLPDTRVLVRIDPADLGRAWLFDAEGETYLGEAICPELAGIDPAAFVAMTRKAHAEILRDGTAAIRAEMKSLTHRDVADMILRQGAKDAGVLVEFPRPAVAHTTPALEAAHQVATGEPAGPAPPADAGATADKVHVLRPMETREMRYARALALEADMAGGRGLSPDDARWLHGYQLGSEHAAMKAMVEDFGEAALR